MAARRSGANYSCRNEVAVGVARCHGCNFSKALSRSSAYNVPRDVGAGWRCGLPRIFRTNCQRRSVRFWSRSRFVRQPKRRSDGRTGDYQRCARSNDRSWRLRPSRSLTSIDKSVKARVIEPASVDVGDLNGRSAPRSDDGTLPAARRGLALGKALSLQATPTILVNGLQLGRPPSEGELIAIIQRELAGKR